MSTTMIEGRVGKGVQGLCTDVEVLTRVAWKRGRPARPFLFVARKGV